MYYIYEYPGYKIGVTKRELSLRDKENKRAYAKRGISLPEIVLLESTVDIEYATRRERELQVERGYPTDDRNYKLSLIGNKHSMSKDAIIKRKKTYKENYLTSDTYKENCKKYSNLRRGIAIKMGKQNSKKVAQYSLQGELIRVFNSITEASIEMKCSGNAIASVCKQKYGCITVKGFKWKYA